jgi:hypothetical protein
VFWLCERFSVFESKSLGSYYFNSSTADASGLMMFGSALSPLGVFFLPFSLNSLTRISLFYSIMEEFTPACKKKLSYSDSDRSMTISAASSKLRTLKLAEILFELAYSLIPGLTLALCN